jgi:serine/threonine kinase 38
MGYSKECDFWSLGIVMYECLFGKTPFHTVKIEIFIFSTISNFLILKKDDPNPVNTYQKILDWKTNMQFPSEKVVSSEAKDLISKLLCDVPHRITFEQLKEHPFFKNINWESIKSTDAPIIPRVESDIDTQNFDEFFEIYLTTLPQILLYNNKKGKRALLKKKSFSLLYFISELRNCIFKF